MRHVAIRPDGGAVAIAVGDSALVATLGVSSAPLVLRTQTDVNGTDWPVAWVGSAFDAPDAVIEALRVRRAGPLASAPLDLAGTSPLRSSHVQRSYFVPAEAQTGPRGARGGSARATPRGPTGAARP